MNKFAKKAEAFFSKEGRAANGIFVLAVAFILALNVLLYVLVEAFGLYLYQKEETAYTITGNTDVLFEDAISENKKIKISFCLAKDELEAHSTGSVVHKTALEFQKRYPSLVELDYINVMTRRNSKGELVDLDRYKTDMRGEETYVLKTSVIFECGNNYRVITDAYTSTGFSGFFTLNSENVADAYNGEEVMAAMMSWVLKDEHKTVYFTQYHGEVVDIAFSNLLSCAGYYIDVIDLRSERVPDDAAMVVIANPKTDFEKGAEGSNIVSEIERLRSYLARGGNLLVTLDPYVKKLAVFESFIAEHGIAFSTTETDSGRLARNIVKDPSNAITVDGFTLVADYAAGQVAKSISDKVSEFDSGDVILREVSALTLSNGAQPILVSSSSSVLEADGKQIDAGGGYTLAAYSENTTENGVSKLVVIPSVYLAVSDALVSRGYSNKNFIYALFELVFGSDPAPYGCEAYLYDNMVLENLTMRKAKIYTALIMIVPVILSVCGAAIIVKRKNR